ncbi:MAG: 4Fe-4S binding protein [Bacillota bacterium]
MSVRINRSKCDGCKQARETLCMLVCPGDLLFKDMDNKAAVRQVRDCWDCAACVKECPRGAIEMYLPAEIGGRGSTLTAQRQPGGVLWTLTDPRGRIKQYFVVG